MFYPTHRHADGGLYQYVGPQLGKSQLDSEGWTEGVAYRNEEGMLFWTTDDRWAERFRQVTEGHTEVIELRGSDDVVAAFKFSVHEAGDVRYMLITAGRGAGRSLTTQEQQWITRVLQAQAEAVTKGLHIRDIDFPDMVGDVNAFHAKFGQEYTGKPRMLPDDLFDFRVKFHDEETHEYRDEQLELSDAIKRRDRRDIINSLELQLDALCDAAWVILGTADLQFGREAFNAAWRRVVKANMAKVRKDATTDGDGSIDSGRAAKYDIVKPAGWQAPDHRDLVSDNAIFDELFGEAAETDTVMTAQEVQA